LRMPPAFALGGGPQPRLALSVSRWLLTPAPTRAKGLAFYAPACARLRADRRIRSCGRHQEAAYTEHVRALLQLNILQTVVFSDHKKTSAGVQKRWWSSVQGTIACRGSQQKASSGKR
jgi:hypothetical protein